MKTDKDSSAIENFTKFGNGVFNERMANSGFDQDEILEVYNANNNDEHKTCVELTKMLLPQPLSLLLNLKVKKSGMKKSRDLK